MQTVLAALVTCTLGCGTLLNNKPATIIPPPGASVDGNFGPVVVNQQAPHEIVYPNGARCIVESRVGFGYLLADVFLTAFIGVFFDATSGHWKVLDAGMCPGVIVGARESASHATHI